SFAEKVYNLNASFPVVKAPTVTMFVMVALMVCVVIMTIQDLKGDASDFLKLRFPKISAG
ncbi:TPA: hypothetical protein ACHKS0_005043, partial [Escherichia coli]